jgi:hypothetical protein
LKAADWCENQKNKKGAQVDQFAQLDHKAATIKPLLPLQPELNIPNCLKL